LTKSDDQIKYIKGHKGSKQGEGEETTKTVNLCKEYKKDAMISKLMGTSVAFFIIAVNTILKIFIIKLIMWIGEDTFSKQLTSITNMVFIA
jgi:hypothetical protein